MPFIPNFINILKSFYKAGDFIANLVKIYP